MFISNRRETLCFSYQIQVVVVDYAWVLSIFDGTYNIRKLYKY